MNVMNLDKIKGIALSAAIAIILALFVNVGVATFYKEPKYEDFCTRGASIDVIYPEGDYYPYNAYPARVKEPGVNVCAKVNLAYDNFRKNCYAPKNFCCHYYCPKRNHHKNSSRIFFLQKCIRL